MARLFDGVLLVGLAALVVCCAPYPTPIVDLEGKDPVQANRDLAECKAITERQGGFGNPTVRCLQGRGYHVLSAQ